VTTLLLWFGIVAAGVAFAMLFLLALSRVAPDRTDKLLRSVRARKAETDLFDLGPGEAGVAFSRAAADLLDRVPRPKGLDARVQRSLDRAGWPLRATEFFMLQAGVMVAGGVVGFVLLNMWWLGVALMFVGAALPVLLLGRRVEARATAFAEQLPETLQLLSGSLQAGYGLTQALDTLVKEAAAPTSTEFSRVLTETRLGMALEESLEAMAERIGSEDFRWVVLAINIQRQVGGNLAVLLQTTAETLRDRQLTRRQIKVLSAEGRLSARILILMPFLLGAYIVAVNPGYLNRLFRETPGIVMVAGAATLMVAGIAWMRKIVRIDV
jgi:tight adherence protein B